MGEGFIAERRRFLIESLGSTKMRTHTSVQSSGKRPHLNNECLSIESMDDLDKKTFRVSRGLDYRYYRHPAKGELPTVLLLHGFPDTAVLWSDIVSQHLIPCGYGIIALDCLGYGETSKPLDTEAYSFLSMTNDVIEILDAESLATVISLGHDWGSTFAQRIYNLHAERVLGLVMVNVAYIPPSEKPFDVKAAIAATQELFGYGTFWYWELFGSDNGPRILNDHLDAFWDLAYGSPDTWLDTLCKPGATENWLLRDTRGPTESFVTEDQKEAFIKRMARDRFDAPLLWYRATVQGIQTKPELAVPKDNIAVNVPTLFVAGTQDVVCRPELIQPSVEAGLLPRLTIVNIDSGHWTMHARPQEFGECVVAWLKTNF
jgi:pimeloyl-ACP methyl ester carboxylesterase